MEFGFASYGLAFLAGVLSTLSPCVLPLVPIVLGSAVAAHRWGAMALIVGLMASYTVVGIVVTTVGSSLGLDGAVFRNIGAAVLVAAGLVLLFPVLQARLALATSGASNGGHVLLSKINVQGLRGQLLIGLVLGAVWSPCVGPTLGAAIALASQGKDLAKVALLMATFALGAGTPMLALGALSRNMVARLRGKLLSVGSAGKAVLGVVVLLVGLLTLTGFDKNIETVVVNLLPQWLTDLTTRF